VYNDRASTKRIVWTLVGWAVGLLVLGAIIVGISTALAPKIPSDKAPVPAATPSSTVPATQTAPGSVSPALPAATVPAPGSASIAAPSATQTDPAKHEVVVATPEKTLSGKVIAIDAGHQAKGDSAKEPIGPGSPIEKAKVTTGATGTKTHTAESLINLSVAVKLRKELESRGASVVMVRTTQEVNISNAERAALANGANADLFIRLHCDSNVSHALSGLSTLVPKPNTWTRPIVAESRKAGGYVQAAVIEETRAKSRGVVSRSDLSGFNWSQVPTVLVEMGFLSNSEEDLRLGTPVYQQKLAFGLANGIEKYLTVH